MHLVDLLSIYYTTKFATNPQQIVIMYRVVGFLDACGCKLWFVGGANSAATRVAEG